MARVDYRRMYYIMCSSASTAIDCIQLGHCDRATSYLQHALNEAEEIFLESRTPFNEWLQKARRNLKWGWRNLKYWFLAILPYFLIILLLFIGFMAGVYFGP